MFRAYLAAGGVFAGLALGGAAAIAQEIPLSAAHQQARLANDPAACGKAVEKAGDDIGLRIQDHDGHIPLLASTWLQAAQNAAENDDEQTCWYWYDRVQKLAR